MNNRKVLFALDYIISFFERFEDLLGLAALLAVSCLLLMPLSRLFEDRKSSLLVLDTVYYTHHLIFFVFLLHALIADTLIYRALSMSLGSNNAAGCLFLRAYFQAIEDRIDLFYRFLRRQASSINQFFSMPVAAGHQPTSAERIIHLSANRGIKRKLKLSNLKLIFNSFITGQLGNYLTGGRKFEALDSNRSRISKDLFDGAPVRVGIFDLRFSGKRRKRDGTRKNMQKMPGTNYWR